jgi:hypothetical protein
VARIRHTVTARATLLLGYVYFWGGRSAFSLPLFKIGHQLTGLDCSGLVSILYRSVGMILPRDASKQAMRAKRVALRDLLPGDVFFYGIPNSTTHSVFHVMMLYELSPIPKLVESAPNSTRILPIEKVFGKPFSQLVYGEKLTHGMDPGSYLTWGSFFH